MQVSFWLEVYFVDQLWTWTTWWRYWGACYCPFWHILYKSSWITGCGMDWFCHRSVGSSSWRQKLSMMSFSSRLGPRFQTQGNTSVCHVWSFTSPWFFFLNFEPSSCHQRIRTIPSNPLLCESFPSGSKGLQTMRWTAASVPSSHPFFRSCNPDRRKRRSLCGRRSTTWGFLADVHYLWSCCFSPMLQRCNPPCRQSITNH